MPSMTFKDTVGVQIETASEGECEWDWTYEMGPVPITVMKCGGSGPGTCVLSISGEGVVLSLRKPCSEPIKVTWTGSSTGATYEVEW